MNAESVETQYGTNLKGRQMPKKGQRAHKAHIKKTKQQLIGILDFSLNNNNNKKAYWLVRKAMATYQAANLETSCSQGDVRWIEV